MLIAECVPMPRTLTTGITGSRRRRASSPVVDDPRVAEVVRRIVFFLHPRRVILFGSRARGDNVPKSDIDLAVDAPDRRPRAYWALLDDIDRDPPTLLGIDLVLLDEIGADFRARITREGRVLYDHRAA
jgi:predicted nucleotidyltransferase